MTIYILGAGPTALAAIDGFSEIANEDIVLIEGSDSVGGFAETLVRAAMSRESRHVPIRLGLCSTRRGSAVCSIGAPSSSTYEQGAKNIQTQSVRKNLPDSRDEMHELRNAMFL